MPRSKRIIDIAPPHSKDVFKQPEQEVQKNGTVKKKNAARRTRPIVFVLFFLVIISAGALGIIHFMFSHASVKLWPQSREVQAQGIVFVQGNQTAVDFDTSALPGKLFQAEKTLTKLFPATGTKTQDAKAQGTIRVFNSQGNPQILIATTRFMSQDGHLFRSLVRVVIPANSFLDVQVAAVQTGPDFNIGPSNFSLPGLAGTALYTLVYGKSSQNMTGGVSKSVSVVAVADLSQAKAALLDEVTRLAKDELAKQVQAPWTIENSAIDIEPLDLSTIVKAGAELAQFNMKGSVRVSALAYQQSQLKDFASHALQTQLQNNEALNLRTFALSVSPKDFDAAGGKLSLNFTSKATAYYALNINQVRTALEGQKKTAAETLLQNFSGVSRFEIRFWPAWLSSVPNNANRVNVSLVLD